MRDKAMEAQVAPAPSELGAATLEPAANDVAIAVRDIGKMYVLYDKPEDRLKQALFWRFGWSYGREFWALRGISFDVRRGEALGIIGRNGSGKSTLLQIIAGTINPTVGHVQVSGRVSALLELGSGFNPEYTGRENAFLNGVILGLSRAEIEQRFDEIAAFADIGDFIDQPVKLYSSGMFARLAFSVAICLDPTILIVDEILAVGDYGFQQKCVARLRRMRDNGLTLLFVSHSPDAIKSICEKGLFLIDGRLEYWGAAEPAVDLYFHYIRKHANLEAMKVQPDVAKAVSFADRIPGKMRYGTGHVQIEKVELTDFNGEPCTAFAFGDAITIHIHFITYVDLENLSVSFLVRDLTGIDLFGTTSFDERVKFPTMHQGERGRVTFRFNCSLHSGNFGISVALNRVTHSDYSDNVLFDQIDSVAHFVVLPVPNRPLHYKFFVPVEIGFSTKE